MSQLLWANNASTTLTAVIGTSSTSIVLAGGTGALFPSPGSNQYFLGTLSPATPGAQAPEIVRVTARSTDTLTVVRAREGTTAQNWGIGTIFQNLITRGTFEAVAQIETYAGNPNGNVAGAQATTATPPSTVWDTTNSLLWVCTTSGPAANAVWIAQAPLNSPTLTGTPTAPTRTVGDSSAALANTAFVAGALASKADIAGNSSQLFNVANAVSNPNAVNLGQVTALIAGLLYPGMMMEYGGTTAPSGWLLCDGSAISRSLYAPLFAVINTAYGAGDGSSTFNLPDRRGKFGIGVSGSYARGTSGGSLTSGSTVLTTAQLPPHNHNATVNDPGHFHSQQGQGNISYSGGVNGNGATNNFSNTGSSTTGISVSIDNTGNGEGHNHTVTPPYVASNVIIKI